MKNLQGETYREKPSEDPAVRDQVRNRELNAVLTLAAGKLFVLLTTLALSAPSHPLRLGPGTHTHSDILVRQLSTRLMWQLEQASGIPACPLKVGEYTNKHPLHTLGLP